VRQVTRGRNDRGEQVHLWEGPLEEDPSGRNWADEASIFSFLGLPYIPPEDRTADLTTARLEQMAGAPPDCCPPEEECVLLATQPAASSSTWRARGVVGLDCEFVGVGRNTAGIGGDRNALARISVVAYSGEVLLDTFVKVEEEVVDFRIHVTGARFQASGLPHSGHAKLQALAGSRWQPLPEELDEASSWEVHPRISSLFCGGCAVSIRAL